MNYEYEDLGNGLSLPCIHMDLTHAPVENLKSEIFRIIDEKGGLLFRDAGLFTPKKYSEFLARINFCHHSYVGGTAPRTDLGDGIYTATDLPADFTVMPHQEMTYLDNAPDYISFYCYEPPSNGQKTQLLADVRALEDQLPWDLKKRYQGKRARLRRILPPEGSAEVLARREKSWQEMIGVKEKEQALEIGDLRGWDLQWTEGDYLVIEQEPARFFRDHPVHGEIWCNQGLAAQPLQRLLVAEIDCRSADAQRLRTTIAENTDHTDVMIMEDGSRVPDGDVSTWFELCLAAKTEYALDRGEIIILDNMLMAHGRSTFTGTRTMYTALGDRCR